MIDTKPKNNAILWVATEKITNKGGSGYEVFINEIRKRETN